MLQHKAECPTVSYRQVNMWDLQKYQAKIMFKASLQVSENLSSNLVYRGCPLLAIMAFAHQLHTSPDAVHSQLNCQTILVIHCDQTTDPIHSFQKHINKIVAQSMGSVQNSNRT